MQWTVFRPRGAINALLRVRSAGGLVVGGRNSTSWSAISDKPIPAAMARVSAVWDDEWSRQQRQRSEVPGSGSPFRVQLMDASLRDCAPGVTTPYSIFSDISRSLAKDGVVASVDGRPWPVNKPILHRVPSAADAPAVTGPQQLSLFKFDSEEGKAAFWRSASAVLTLAMLQHYPGSIDCGHVNQNEGFYADVEMGDARVHPSEYGDIVKLMHKIIRAQFQFETMRVPMSVAQDMFAENPFLTETLALPPATLTLPSATGNATDRSGGTGDDRLSVGVYRCGPLVGLSDDASFVADTSVLKAIALTKSSGAYFLGDPKRDLVQRVYGVAFPKQKDLKAWEVWKAEADQRDHRVVGKNQELFMFHSVSPGSAFFLPHGTRIYNRLTDFLRKEYQRRGYEEVITPLLFSKDLWKQSGHWDHYREDMFSVHGGCDHDDADGEEMGLKPMNCPAHCLIFANRPRSYRELPIRLADFSALHRNEASGALSGLTRVRRFCQDDAHIFCTEEQMGREIKHCVDFVEAVYRDFGFSFKLCLSTRPDDYAGELALWNKAEAALKDSLDRSGHSWELNPGDGAFYGPKIDVTVTDAHGRSHQCATVQLDFVLPRRFALEYSAADQTPHTPVIIHRAILGSVERMLAILSEHTAGRWPFWLSPRQVSICPVADRFNDYAFEVAQTLKENNVYVNVNDSSLPLKRKIRDSQVEQYNYILVVGQQEVDNGTVAVRTRSGELRPEVTVDALCEEFEERMRTRASDC